jgi:hypothetical protein
VSLATHLFPPTAQQMRTFASHRHNPDQAPNLVVL